MKRPKDAAPINVIEIKPEERDTTPSNLLNRLMEWGRKTAGEWLGERSVPKTPLPSHFSGLPKGVLEEIERKQAAYEEACKPVTKKLRALGLRVTGIDESLNAYLPLTPEVVEVLLESLPEMQNWHVVEWIARYIGTATQPYDGRPLADAFDKCPDHHPKWAIGDAFSRSKPQHIENWLVQTLKNPEHGDARQMLCFAASRLLPADTANDALVVCFDDMPGHAGGALRKTGGQRELEFLRERCERQRTLKLAQSKTDRWTRWQAKTVQKAIAAIERRLEKEAAKATAPKKPRRRKSTQ